MTAICQTGEMTRTLDRLPRSRSSSRQLRSPRAASDLAFKWRVCVGRHYSPGISQGKVNNQNFRHTQSEFGRFLMRGPWGGPGNWSRSRCGMRIHDCVKRMRQEQHSILAGRVRGINEAISPKEAVRRSCPARDLKARCARLGKRFSVGQLPIVCTLGRLA